ncbi:MAG: hypothetical protein QNJ90_09225 [Planctomycetota bacterium]|nr:hypothetical protein [Planctomycetota bacterium]
MPQPAPVERNRIASATFLRARGRGRIEVELKGTGQLTMIRGRYDDFCFEGKGLPRHLSATCVHLRAAHGRVILEGEDLELEFFGGTCTALLVGTFQVETRGTGAPKPAARQASEMPTKTSKKLKDRRSSPRR